MKVADLTFPLTLEIEIDKVKTYITVMNLSALTSFITYGNYKNSPYAKMSGATPIKVKIRLAVDLAKEVVVGNQEFLTSYEKLLNALSVEL